jgi:hypothetical protein
VSENGDRPNANHANCPGWKRKSVPAGGVNATAVVSPGSAVTRATCQGRASARRGFSSRTQTSRQTNAADIRAHRICFHSEPTYSSTKMMCPTAPTTRTTASTVWMACHAS